MRHHAAGAQVVMLCVGALRRIHPLPTAAHGQALVVKHPLGSQRCSVLVTLVPLVMLSNGSDRHPHVLTPELVAEERADRAEPCLHWLYPRRADVSCRVCQRGEGVAVTSSLVTCKTV